MPKGKDKEEGADIEILPSNQAIDTVASWLGLTAGQALPQEDATVGTSGKNEPQKRPKFLGLGATYVPHHKAVGFAAAIDERLKRRLESGSKRKAAQSLEEGNTDIAIQRQENGPRVSNTMEGRKNSRHHHQQLRGSTLGQSTSAAGFTKSSEDDEDDEKGKAAMVGRHRNPAPSAGPPGQGPNAVSKAEREAILLGGFSEPVSGKGQKRKRRKEKGSEEGGSMEQKALD